MANEFLTRIPTSTGNQKVFTYSCWIKRNKVSAWMRLLSIMDGNTDAIIQLTNADKLRFRDEVTGPDIDYISSRPLRDVGSWMHLLVAIDTTATQAEHRIRMYINGDSLIEHGLDTESMPGDKNLDLQFNDKLEHRFFARNNNSEYFFGEAFDLFWVDGQALTPDVFGFNKDGDGYVSVGSTQSTDFRPGQWSPKAPRIIKSEINRRGGFGVNGFYLPMNDSSNFGADFHCTPNSIIKLKGEDLPQPRNGLPTTSDNYVSQLREDPYAANLVLAVPGVNTQPTGSELVTNGTFDTNVSGWTVTDTGSIVRQSDGTAKVTRGSSAEVVYQDITTVVGTTYELSVDITDIAGSHGQVYVKSTPHSGIINTPIGYSFYPGTFKGTFTADTTTTRIILYAHPSGSTSYDNISVKATTIPDYSADIKGSGTNKTLIPYADANVSNPHQRNGRNVNGYYGSALSFDGSDDYIDAPASSDYNLGTGDYTIECWVNSVDITTSGHYKRIWDLGSGLFNSLSMTIQSTDNSFKFRYNDGIILQSPANTAHIRQWSHVVLERHGSKLSLYLNGVVVQAVTNHTASYDYSSNTFRIGRNHETSSNGLASTLFGYIQDLRFYKGVAKYKGGFDVSRPYSPENGSTNYGIETWRQVPDTCKNNFATLNAVDYNSSTTALSDGNLTMNATSNNGSVRSATYNVPNSGKYYFEFYEKVIDVTTTNYISIVSVKDDSKYQQYRGYGYIYTDGVQATGYATMDEGDLVGVGIDADNGTVSFYNNGTLVATVTSSSVDHVRGARINSYLPRGAGSYPPGDTRVYNFGQNPTFSGTITEGTTYTDSNGKGLFKYQPPSGFLSLCEDNLPTPAIADPGEHFKTVLYTGDGSSGRSITGVGFQPDFVWIKERGGTSNHNLYDSVRGVTKRLYSDLVNTEYAYTNGNGVNSFDSDGFSFGADGALNQDGIPTTAWCWKAGGPAVTNTDGSITSQVSANQTAGFSIVSYTGTGSAGTVGHGLGKAPSLIITKHRAGTSLGNINWNVSTSVIPGGYLELNTAVPHNSMSDRYVTAGTNTNSFPGGYAQFNDSNRTYISYCWAEIEGYSKIGSYVGNGNADGPFVYCGFKPAWVMVKRSTTGGNEGWPIYDSSRGPTNPNPFGQYANDNGAENSASGRYKDFLSNGFKIRGTSGEQNTNGITYFFMAFAESPFQTANAK